MRVVSAATSKSFHDSPPSCFSLPLTIPHLSPSACSNDCASTFRDRKPSFIYRDKRYSPSSRPSYKRITRSPYRPVGSLSRHPSSPPLLPAARLRLICVSTQLQRVQGNTLASRTVGRLSELRQIRHPILSATISDAGDSRRGISLDVGSPLYEERGSTRAAAVSMLNCSRKEDKRRSKVISLIGPTASAFSRLFLSAEELFACIEEMPKIYLFIQLADRVMERNKTEKKVREINRQKGTAI